MASNAWVNTPERLPAEGRVVLTRDSGGHEQPLKRSGRLWFFPDGGMYVYYVPVAWLDDEGEA